MLRRSADTMNQCAGTSDMKDTVNGINMWCNGIKWVPISILKNYSYLIQVEINIS